MTPKVADPQTVLLRADTLRREIGDDFRDRIVSSLYADAQRIADRSVRAGSGRKWDWDQKVDRVSSRRRCSGLPIMLGILALIFWLTIVGANYPSQMLAEFFFVVEARGRWVVQRLGCAVAGSPGSSGTACFADWPGW